MFTQVQIAEAVGPDAWAWAAKKGFLSDEHTIERIINEWYHEGSDPRVADKLGGLIFIIAGEYLREYEKSNR